MAADSSGGAFSISCTNKFDSLSNMEYENSDTHTSSKRKAYDKSANLTDEFSFKKPNIGNTTSPTDDAKLSNSTKDKNQSMNNNSKNSSIIFYREGIPGPYSVWVRNLIANKQVSPFKIGSLVFKRYSSIKDIFRRSRSKVEIVLASREQANALAQDKVINSNGFEAFVPEFRRTRKGVIRGIDPEFCPEDILEGIKCPGPHNINVNSVHRMNRKNKLYTPSNDESQKWIPTRSIIRTFEGQVIPEYLYGWGARVKVEVYVQRVMQCYNCFKFGHTSKTCRSDKIYFNCGDLDHKGECPYKAPRCANCAKDNPEDAKHVSVSSSCPKFIEQKKINNIMAYENLSFAEAKALVSHRRQTTGSFTGKTAESHPLLSKVLSNSGNQSNNHQKSNQTSKNQSSGDWVWPKKSLSQ
ncbi:hypothetical protein TKK_0017297 [Trichogramma kaykai]|uniref:CCHC-type domain-containing protein n=1 Tax=Trichogramma kaykai TaxID=54128 RepID=A0ABD2W333_9HYME